MTPYSTPDLADIPAALSGAVEALIDAVAARRPALLVGPPGAGRTMLACRVPGILPTPSADTLTAIGHACLATGLPNPGCRPFRAPHYTVRTANLVGTREHPEWSEVAFARHGVLYLDNLPEFHAATVGSLIEAVEAMTSDVRPYLIGSALPCPCGWHGVTAAWAQPCECRADALDRYRRRLAGLALALPVRVDLPAWKPCSPASSWTDVTGPWTSAAARERIAAAWGVPA